MAHCEGCDGVVVLWDTTTEPPRLLGSRPCTGCGHEERIAELEREVAELRVIREEKEVEPSRA